ncbi:MAG: cytochrome c [Pseudomonadota bacterium]
MRKLAFGLVLFAACGVALAWILTAPKFENPDDYVNLVANADAGEQIFHASGCASCHAAADATPEAKLILTGGVHFNTDFGTFIAPNISPSSQGIADWDVVTFATALMKGTSPSGKHYYPAFPYTSYQNMAPQDIVDLFAFMQTLPKSDVPSAPHGVSFPFNIRRSLGGWKLLFMRSDYVTPQTDDPVLQKGQYLVEALGHCGECHTARNALGGPKRSAWLKGGPNPDGRGTIPDITPAGLGWAAAEIVEYLQTGFTPDFDVVGGSMVSVQENMALLPDSDLEAIAAYLLSL